MQRICKGARRAFAMLLALCIICSNWGITLNSMAASDSLGDEIQAENTTYIIISHWHAVKPEGVEDTADDSYYLVEDRQLLTTYGQTYSVVPSVLDEDYERFSGFSIAAGETVIDTVKGEDKLKITYDPMVPLVKVNVFYIQKQDVVPGFNFNDESAPLYSELREYYSDVEDDYWTSGEVDSALLPYKVEDDGTVTDYKDDDGNDVLLKYYNTDKGLHTDKSVEAVDVNDKGGTRTFDISLESWYSGVETANVGMILDASGSMEWIQSDELEPIIIDSTKFESINNSLSSQGIPALEEKKILTQAQYDMILDKTKTDNTKLGYSGYSYYIYDDRESVSEYVPLGYTDAKHTARIAGFDGDDMVNSDIARICREQELLGYFDFDKNLDNEFTGKKAQFVKNDADGIHINEKSEGNAQYTDAGKGKDGGKKDYGYRVNKSARNGTTNNHGEGSVLLDIAPDSTFTISFAVKSITNKNFYYENGKNEIENTTPIDIMYIGDKNYISKENNGVYYRIYRDVDTNADKLVFSEYNNKEESKKSNLSIFHKKGDTSPAEKNWHIISYVISSSADEEGNVVYNFTAYDGTTKKEEVQITPLSVNSQDMCIVLSPALFGKYTGTDDCDVYLDKLYVFDGDFSGKDVDEEIKKINNRFDTVKTVDESGNKTYNAFFNEDGKTSFATMTPDSFIEEDPEKIAGWYYVNNSDRWKKMYINNNLLTDKQYRGIDATTNDGKGGTVNTNIRLDEESMENIKDGDNSASILYLKKVDDSYQLWCIANGSDSGYTRSQVYEKRPGGNIKMESLQFALGAFVNRLSEVSPKSCVSAVRFSTERPYAEYSNKYDKTKDSIKGIFIDDENAEKNNELKKLVLLDWTNDPKESASILDHKRGDGTTAGFTISEKNKIEQYNYGLTGGTETWTGLKSYAENLDPYIGDDAKKYLIIFTDGRDDSEMDVDKATAKSIATELKSKGYTIYVAVLNGSNSGESTTTIPTHKAEEGMDPGNAGVIAKNFLRSLAGPPNSGAEYTDASERNDYLFIAQNGDELLNYFEQDLLNRVVKPLDGYTVQDYIDPRFNLVTSEGVIHLNNNGKISINDDTGTIDIIKEYSNSYPVEFDCKNNKDAFLKYDSGKNMYYLQWINCLIPGCSVGDNLISVWNTHITIQAKDDFIGGNNVLTNGNEADENMVYDPKDEDASSGTDRSGVIDDEMLEYPSKGFPRTTVNVELLPLGADGYRDVIYTGEWISPKQMLLELRNYIKDSNYWSYLDRYGKFNSEDAYRDIYDGLFKLDTDGTGDGEGKQDIDDLLKALWESGEEGISIPYSYLPYYDDSGMTNTQTGTDAHRKDIMGVLTYNWKMIPQTKDDEDDESTSAGGAESADDGDLSIDDAEIKDTVRRQYALSVVYTPWDDVVTKDEHNTPVNPKYNTRGEMVDTLVNEETEGVDPEPVYGWDSSYKPAPGKIQSQTEVERADYYKDVISGGLAVELKFTPAQLKELKNDDFKDVGDSIYLTLERSYNDAVSGEKNDVADHPDISIGNALFNGKEWKDVKVKGTDKIDPYTKRIDLTFNIEWGDITGANIDWDKPETYNDKVALDSDGNIIVMLTTDNKIELPIGTYRLYLPADKAGSGTSSYFNTINAASNSEYKAEYFTDNVKKGIADTLYEEIELDDGKHMSDKSIILPDERKEDSDYIGDRESKNEIIDANITKYIAEHNSSTYQQYVTFYLGTKQVETTADDGSDNTRGDIDPANTAGSYLMDRLAVAVLAHDEGKLAITKEVQGAALGSADEADRLWQFEVIISQKADAAQPEETLSVKYYDADGEVKDAELKAEQEKKLSKPTPTLSEGVNTYKYNIWLSSGQKAVIEGLPVGAEYTVTELGANTGVYNTLVDGTTEVSKSGEIKSNVEEGSEGPQHDFVNMSPTPEDTGGLLLSKILENENPDTGVSKYVASGDDLTKKFPFTVTFTFPEVEPDSDNAKLIERLKTVGMPVIGLVNNELINKSGITITVDPPCKNEFVHLSYNSDDGTYSAVFELSQAQQVVMYDLPVGTTYTVTEQYTGTGYYLSREKTTGMTGTIGGEGAGEVIIENGGETVTANLNEAKVYNSNAISLPSTGGRGVYGIMLAGGFMMIISLGLLYLRKRREYRA